MIKEGENPLSGISETANYFVDVEEYIEIPDSFVIVISETTRTKLESCIKLVGEFAWFQPTLNIYIIYLNIMEYCKIGGNTSAVSGNTVCQVLLRLPALMKYILKKNRIVMIESQYSNRLPIRKLSSPIRAVLKI